ncbi:MAG TPA: glycosyltransferase [Candidatus Acidoferrum sp.]|nr:glycosyltransferase [Candidatus Acidoferrum sp.]
MKSAVEQKQRVTRPYENGGLTPSLENARIAIVHYWFVAHRGGERVVEAIADMFPAADLFTLIADPDAVPKSLRGRSLHTSFLQDLPGSKRLHRRLLPFYPMALEQFDLNGYDLVLSSESGPAKGVLTSAGTCHVCYCHSPMRYLWDFYHQYKNNSGLGLITRPIFALTSHYLRMWDAASANRVDYFAANSRNVAARIRKHYRRESTVVYPPVNTHAGYLAEKIEDYYLVVGQFVEYKRIDLAIAACNRLGRCLHVVGEGEQYVRLRRLAGPSINFLGAISDEELHEQYAHCRALLFPGEEDFGIVPVEALSFGRPVIAYERGGATETVKGFHPESQESVENSTGVFFGEQTVESLVEAIRAFESIEHRFCPFYINLQASRFASAKFQQAFGQFLANKWDEFHRGGNS